MSNEEKIITQDDNSEELKSATPTEEIEENQNLPEETDLLIGTIEKINVPANSKTLSVSASINALNQIKKK